MSSGITNRSLAAVKPGASVADSKVRGFIARRLPSGQIAFGFRYRDRKTGRRRWLSIGLYGGVTVDEARRIAMKRAGEVADNRDPLDELKTARQAVHTAQTMDRMLDLFLSQYVDKRKLRTKKEIESALNRYVRPAIGKRSVASIRRSDIVQLCDRIAEETSPRRADTILAYMRKAFNWFASRANEDFANPIHSGMSRLKPKDYERERLLSNEELRDFWTALPRVNPVFADVLRLLLYTGQRRSEIAELRRDELEDKIAIIPPSRTKTKVENVVPFGPRAQRIVTAYLDRLKPDAEFVFWARGGGKTPLQGWSAQKKALDIAIAEVRKERNAGPMRDWRIHDIRRTARTLMSRAGVAADIAERVLSHTMPRMQKIYDRHQYTEEKRIALGLLEAHIHKIVDTT